MPLPPISRRVKLALFSALISEHSIFLDQSTESVIDFADKIWDLRSLPSSDPRFQNAYEDAVQHMVRNADWTWEYFFIDQLKLADDDTKFFQFVEAVVSPTNRESEDDITKFVFLINQYLESSNLELFATEVDEQTDLPIHRIQDTSQDSTSSDLKKNEIPIHIIKNVPRFANRRSSHEAPVRVPAFVLVFNQGWNDFGYYTTFVAFLYDENGDAVNLGEVKLAYDKPHLIGEGEVTATLRFLDDNYLESIPLSFCSLGQSREYYLRMKEAIGLRRLESLLFALRDAAFFSELREKYQTNFIFNRSLLRDSENEQIMRQIRAELYGADPNNLYKFTYVFKPPYAEEPTDLRFEFTNERPLPHRIYALIGKNGTGKTQLITSLPLDIAKKHNEKFIPKTPLFSKVIAVSYSVFDRFKIPRKTASFNYVYCGLKNQSGELLSDLAKTRRFNKTLKAIKVLGRIDQWRSVLIQFIDEEIIDEFFITKDSVQPPEEDPNNPEANSKNSFNIEESKLGEFRTKLSSGQNIMFYVISEIVANIMYDSLLLFDEPETHLHPNAITELMNTVDELVNQFQSYCIMATHSPLVIRELPSRNVLVITRRANVPSVKRISIESFGENLTTLTEEVFGNKDIPKRYKAIIDQLVKSGMTFEEIVKLLQSDGVTFSLNARIYIKSMINERA